MPLLLLPRTLLARTARVSRAGLSLVALGAALLLGPLRAHADRFGPPWMDKVSADSTTLYAAPDRAQSIGPLARDAIVVVIGQEGDMVRIPDGWVPAADLAETTDPWVAEVADPSVSVLAYPQAHADVRRTGQQGDLLRVTGVAHGVADDNDLWWATTEGYVPLHAIRAATNDWALHWTLPAADLARSAWWGQASAANVRAGPSPDAPLLGELGGGEYLKVLAEEQGDEVAGSATWYRIDGGRFAGGYVHSSLVARVPAPRANTAPPPPDEQLGDKPWIVVDRPTHTLTLMRNGQPDFATYVSLGKAGQDTPEGDYQTWGKYRADRMSNAANPEADHPYNLPNVPYVQYYKDGGYAIHGTYWHDQFNTNESQGCINLTVTDAAYLFSQSLPQLPDGAASLLASNAPSHDATPVEILGH